MSSRSLKVKENGEIREAMRHVLPRDAVLARYVMWLCVSLSANRLSIYWTTRPIFTNIASYNLL